MKIIISISSSKANCVIDLLMLEVGSTNTGNVVQATCVPKFDDHVSKVLGECLLLVFFTKFLLVPSGTAERTMEMCEKKFNHYKDKKRGATLLQMSRETHL